MARPRPASLQACSERIKADTTGEAHCTGQVRQGGTRRPGGAQPPGGYAVLSTLAGAVSAMSGCEPFPTRTPSRPHTQYFDFWRCIDKCAAGKVFQKVV